MPYRSLVGPKNLKIRVKNIKYVQISKRRSNEREFLASSFSRIKTGELKKSLN